MLDLAKLREKREAGEKGFTLIELLVVVVIIGILIAIAIPVYLNYRKGASDKSAQSDLRNAVNTLEQCNTDNSVYPSAPTNLTGALTGCADQTVTKSDGTVFVYYPSTASPANTQYLLMAYNTKGNGTTTKFFCYSSVAGGAVSLRTPAAAPTAYAAACPANA